MSYFFIIKAYVLYNLRINLMKFLIRTIIFGTILRFASVALWISLWQYGVARPIYYLLIWIAMLSYILLYYIKPYYKNYLKLWMIGWVLMMVINSLMQYFIVWKDHVSKPFINYQYEIFLFIEQQWYVFIVIPFLTIFVGFMIYKYSVLRK